jgi:hypothetical protein
MERVEPTQKKPGGLCQGQMEVGVVAGCTSLRGEAQPFASKVDQFGGDTLVAFSQKIKPALELRHAIA